MNNKAVIFSDSPREAFDAYELLLENKKNLETVFIDDIKINMSRAPIFIREDLKDELYPKELRRYPVFQIQITRDVCSPYAYMNGIQLPADVLENRESFRQYVVEPIRLYFGCYEFN